MELGALDLAAFDAGVSCCPDTDLIGVILAADAGATEAVSAEALFSLALELSTIPFGERRAMGATGLQRRYGLGALAAKRLAALWELAERWAPDQRPQVSSPRDVALLLDELRYQAQERMMVVLLDARQRLIGTELVAAGSLNVARLLPRDVFSPALRRGAVSVIVAHNHPSGDVTPSGADRTLTVALRAAAEILGVQLSDHVIIAGGAHFSFHEADGGWDTIAAQTAQREA